MSRLEQVVALGLLALAGCQQDPPRITGISPGSGPLGGGTGITITGVNFELKTQVTIGGAPATSVAFNGTGSMTATSPPGAALGGADVAVRNPDGQTDKVRKGFTYSNEAPSVTVSSCSPSTGSGGATVTIAGSGFQAGATVKFGTAAALNVTVPSATSITCTTPTGPTGAVSVVVTNPDGGSGTLPSGFTYPGGTGATGATISAFAGTGTIGAQGDGGAALQAQLNAPGGIVVASDGSVFIADTSNHKVRKVDASGNVASVAGTGTAGFSGDGGTATTALLSGPRGLALDSAGVLYVADAGNHCIRALNAGTISTVAGQGTTAGNTGDGGLATAALLSGPAAVAVDGAKNLFIADTGNNRVRRVDAGTKNIDFFAGTGASGFSGDAAAAGSATLAAPAGVLVDGSGNVYVSDTSNARVRRIDTTKTIATLAGGGTAGPGDGGSPAAAQLSQPIGLALDSTGGLLIADAGAHRIRLVPAAGGTISTFAGTGSSGNTGDGGAATSATLNAPRAIATSAQGTVYVVDTGNNRVRQVK